MSSHRLVIKDAAWQLMGRIISAAFGFLTIKIMTPYLGPLRYGDYSTILKYFAIWTALADLWLYVLAVKQLWALKEEDEHREKLWKVEEGGKYFALRELYGKFVGTRVIIMTVIYAIAIVVAYLLPAYTSNPYLVWGLPFGMIFSASFMFAGIQQLPLQIFWRMDQLSWTLITARLSQIAILIPVVYFIFKHVEFNGSTVSIVAFCAILFSVVASAVGQNWEIHWRSKKILPLKIVFDWQFTKAIVMRNRQYGVSYYLSSFHTLIVLLFLGWFLPTSSGHDYTGIWALSLSLIEILLIIPSSLGNSLLHKVSNYSLENKRKSLWNLLLLIYWIGGLIAVNFWIFAPWIIRVVSGKAFLGSFASRSTWWSDQVLPFLGVVLFWSFIKQVYNYLFVAVDRQNILLPINLIGVLVGIPLGIWMIPQYGLLGGVVTQLTIELFFMLWAVWIAKYKHIQPLFSRKIFGKLTLSMIILAGIGLPIVSLCTLNIALFFLVALLLNAAVVWFTLPIIKKIAKGLTIEEQIVNN